MFVRRLLPATVTVFVAVGVVAALSGCGKTEGQKAADNHNASVAIVNSNTAYLSDTYAIRLTNAAAPSARAYPFFALRDDDLKKVKSALQTILVHVNNIISVRSRDDVKAGRGGASPEIIRQRAKAYLDEVNAQLRMRQGGQINPQRTEHEMPLPPAYVRPPQNRRDRMTMAEPNAEIPSPGLPETELL